MADCLKCGRVVPCTARIWEQAVQVFRVPSAAQAALSLLIFVLKQLPTPHPSHHIPAREGGGAEGRQQEGRGNLPCSHFKSSSEAHPGMSSPSSLARAGLRPLPRFQGGWAGRDGLCCGEQASCPLALGEAASP